MATKPIITIEWATDDAVETRQGGNYALNHLNFMFNVLGLWSKFTDDMVEATTGLGTGLTKDEHFCMILAFDTTNLDDYVLGFAYKPTSSAGTTKIISNNTLTFGTPDANGDIPISGATAANVRAFSINFKNS